MKRFSPQHEQDSRAGFTLIELSIVLVIIGLIVGGILVGQDLIKNAQLKATITQVESYNTAVNTFRGKYNAIPGDIANSANPYGMAGTLVLDGKQGHGDGNSLVEDGAANAAGGTNGNKFAGEISEFFAHLTWASLAQGNYGGAGGSLLTAATGLPSTAASASTMAQYIPPAKLGKGMYFTVASGSGQNWYAMLPVTVISTGGVYTLGATGISPIEANNVDVKIDDGLPNTGAVLAIGLTVPAAAATGSNQTLAGMTAASYTASATVFKCTMGTANDITATYNLNATTGGNDPSCGMGFRFN